MWRKIQFLHLFKSVHNHKKVNVQSTKLKNRHITIILCKMDRSLNPAYLQTEQLPFHSNASDWAVVHLHFTRTSDKYQYLHWEQPSKEKKLQVFLFGSQHLIVESALPVFLRLLLKLLVLSLEKPKLGREIPVLLLDNYIYTFLNYSKYTAVKFCEWIYKTQNHTFQWQHSTLTFHSRPTARANSSSPPMTLPAITPTGTSPFSPGLLTVNTTWTAGGQER